MDKYEEANSLANIVKNAGKEILWCNKAEFVKSNY